MAAIVQYIKQSGLSCSFSLWGRCVIGLWLIGFAYAPVQRVSHAATCVGAMCPVAKAGGDMCEPVPEGLATIPVTLDGSASFDPSPGGSITKYIWTRTSTQTSAPHPPDTMQSQISLSPDVSYTFGLVVKDNDNNVSKKDKVKVTTFSTNIVPDPGEGSGGEGDFIDTSTIVNGACASSNMQATGRSRVTTPSNIRFTRLKELDVDDEGGGFKDSPDPNEVVRPVIDGVATVSYQFGPRRIQRVRAKFDTPSSVQEAPFIFTLGAAGGIAIEQDNQLVVTEARRKRVWRVNPDSGTSTVLSDVTSRGPVMLHPQAIAVTSQGLVVTDHGDAQTPARLLLIDPRTGARALLSGCPDKGNGPCFGSPVGIAVQSVGSQEEVLFVLDRVARDQAGSASPAVLQVNLTTGNRRVISANFLFDGQLFNSATNRIVFGFPQGIALTPNGILAVLDGAMPAPNTPGKYAPGILYIDPKTGLRTRGPFKTAAGLPLFRSPLSIAMAGNGALLVVDNDVPHKAPNGNDFLSPAILSVELTADPEVGVQTSLTSNFEPDHDVLLKFPYGVAVEHTGAVVVVDVGGKPTPEPRVLRIDPSSGQITVVSGRNDLRGRGKRFDRPIDLTADTEGMLWVLDGNSGRLSRPGNFRVIRVNPATGHRQDVSTKATSGVYFLNNVVGIAVDKNALSVLDQNAMHRRLGPLGPVVFQVDTITGALTPVFPPKPGSPPRGNRLGQPVDFAAQANGILWILDQATVGINGQNIGPAVWKVDPVSGVGRVVSSNQSGSPLFGKPTGIAVKPNGREVWVVDPEARNNAGNSAAVVWSVNPTSGERTVLAPPLPLPPQDPKQPFGVLRDITIDTVTKQLYALDVRASDLSSLHTPIVWGIDPRGGRRFPVSSNKHFDDGFYANPMGVATTVQNMRVRGMNVRLFAVDPLLEAVVGVALGNCGTRPPPIPCGRRVIVSK